MNSVDFYEPLTGIIPAVASFPSLGNAEIYEYPVYGLTKLCSYSRSFDKVVNASRGSCENEQLVAYDAYHELVLRLVAKVHNETGREVVFFDIQIMPNVGADILVGGEDLSSHAIFSSVIHNLSLSGVNFRIGSSPNGDLLIRSLKKSLPFSQCIQLTFDEDFANTEIFVGLPPAVRRLKQVIKYYEESVCIASDFAEKYRK